MVMSQGRSAGNQDQYHKSEHGQVLLENVMVPYDRNDTPLSHAQL